MIIKKTNPKEDDAYSIFPYKAYLSEHDLTPLSTIVGCDLEALAKEDKLDNLTLVFVKNVV